LSCLTRPSCSLDNDAAISSGIFGYPKKRCAEVMFSTALAFCRDHPDSRLRQIRFTNWDMETVRTHTHFVLPTPAVVLFLSRLTFFFFFLPCLQVTIFEQEFAKRFNSN
jgi:hypothetical protein